MRRFFAGAVVLAVFMAGCSGSSPEPELPTAEGASQFCQKQLTREISTVQTLRFEGEEVEEHSPLNDRWNWIVQGTLVADKDGAVAHYACMVTGKVEKKRPVYAAALSINRAEDQEVSTTHLDMEFREAALAAQGRWVELVNVTDPVGEEEDGTSVQLGVNLSQGERDQVAQQMVDQTSSFAATSSADVEQALDSICEALPESTDPTALMMDLYSPSQGDNVSDVATLVTSAIGARCPDFWATFP